MAIIKLNLTRLSDLEYETFMFAPYKRYCIINTGRYKFKYKVISISPTILEQIYNKRR